MARAQAEVDAADEADARLGGLLDELRSAYADYVSASEGVSSASEGRAAIAERIAELDAADECAAKAAELAQAELGQIEEDFLGSLISSGMTIGQFDDYRRTLEYLAAYDGEGARAAGERAELLARDDELRREFEAEQAAVQERIDACNDAAAEAERCMSDMRSHDRAAGEAVDGIDDSVIGVASTRSQLASIQSVHRENRAHASEVVGEWYDVLDGLSGRASGGAALTFGAGAEFALSEEEFVAKWSAAIDAYYDEYSRGVGRDVPLSGYGEAMARSAWKWRIDPRLCAAVSVTESSGGLYCIRPHNAWGWGAADSDPYGLAWEWGSWEEAIDAWHEGVATSTTGLADAESIEAFGSVYASSPAWPANTATYMQEVGEHAR